VVSRLPHAMAGYVQWLARQMSTLGERLRAELLEVRAASGGQEFHRRVPENMAQLVLGLRTYLRFAQEVGACSPRLAEDIWQRIEGALAEIATRQGQALEAERPVPRFFRGLLALLSTGNAVLVDPIAAGADEPATMLGWADGEWLYLNPEASYRAVARFFRDAGEPYPLRAVRLFQELAEAKLSDCTKRRHTRTWRIGGKSRRVLKLDRLKVETLLGEQFPDPWRPTPAADRGFP
jgi:hypothetical protein